MSVHYNILYFTFFRNTRFLYAVSISSFNVNYVKSGQTWHWIGYLYLYVQQVKSILLFQKMFTTRKWLGRISSRINWKKSNSFKLYKNKYWIWI